MARPGPRASDPTTRKRPLTSRALGRLAGLLLSIVSVLATLLVLEVGFRVVGAATAAKTIEDLESAVGAPATGSTVTLGELIRPDLDPRIVYRLRPDLDVVFRGARVTTNRAGFRGPERSSVVGAETVRIVGIGDSTMFGWGVGDGKDYLSLLEERLNREHPGKRWEVVNTAVPGYNTTMELAALETFGLWYRPDLVVLDVNANDIQLPYFLLERENFLDPERSFLAEFVRGRAAGVRVAGFGAPRLERREYLKLGDTEPDRIPPAYRGMVGWSAFERALEGLEGLSERYGFEVVVTCAHGSFPGYGRKMLAERDFPALCAGRARRRYLAASDPRRDPAPRLTLSEEDSHPSELGHRLMADLLYARLLESGFVERQNDA